MWDFAEVLLVNYLLNEIWYKKKCEQWEIKILGTDKIWGLVWISELKWIF